MDGSLLEDRLWEKLYQDAHVALRQGQHDQALRDFHAAVKVAEEFPQSDQRLVKALTGLGLTYSVRQQFDMAEKPLELSLTLLKKYRGTTNPESLGLLKNLAFVTSKLRKFDKAEKYYTDAITVCEKIQPDHPDITALRAQKDRLSDTIRKQRAVDAQGELPAVSAEVLKTKPSIQKKPTTTVQTPRVPAQPENAPAGSSPPPASPPRQKNETAAPSPAEAAPAPRHSTAAPADPDTLTGFVIDNRYQVYGRIGEGGMSAIYRGKHLFMDRPVAIKILHKHLTASEKVRERFRQEARTAFVLQHPNIVSVHDFGEAHGFFYLVMDYVDGMSLSELIRVMDHLPPDRCVKILKQICDGLQHAHENGILHRDLKPSNIMLLKHGAADDIVKIVDFGIAKVIDTGDDETSLTLTQTGETVGSPLYMSPEQCRGEKLDTRSDIYSLGCLAYKALAGVPPFSGNNQIDVYIKHTQVPAPPFSKVAPNIIVPGPLELVVLKMLEKNASDRFSSMLGVRQALDALNL